MAVSAAAMLLDELMGRDRNLAPTEKRREVRWDDPETCKYFLCGFCPHELFVNTRADLGPCDKIHDEDLKKGYAKSSRFERMGYEEEFMRFLQSLLADVERRIKRGHARLALNSSQGSGNAAGSTSREDQMDILTSRINDLVEEAEELGNEGKVEEAQSVMKLVEQMREERVGHEQADKKGKSREEEMAKKMEVCNVCGALLVAGDAQQRIDEHIMGKQHMGYARIRAYIEQRNSGVPSDETADLLLEREKQREEEKKRQEEEQERTREREQEREKEREKERERVKERDKDHDRDRDRERRRRSRSSSRSRRRRSRSGSKSRRDRDRGDRDRGDRDRGGRDRGDRDRSDRDRSDRDRGDRRDRSRERRRRSRSRDRSRDKDRARDRKRSRSRSRRSHSKSSSRRSSRDRDRERKRSRSRSKSHRSRSRSRDRKDKDRKSSRSSRDKDRDGDKRESSERSRHNGRDGEERAEKDSKDHHGDGDQRGSDVKSDGADGSPPRHHSTTNDTTTKSLQREREGDSP